MVELSYLVVVGSANLDSVVRVPHFPAPGETLKASAYKERIGGKGANQAIQASLLAGDDTAVIFIGKFGDDAHYTSIVDFCTDRGVDTSRCIKTADTHTGIAQIHVREGDGENAIIISAGANGTLTADEVTEALSDVLKNDGVPKVILTQNEIPVEATLAALRTGAEHHSINIFSAAPAQSDLPDEIFQLTDVLLCNQVELSQMLGFKHSTEAGSSTASAIENLVQQLRREKSFHKTVVVTCGKNGCYISEDETTSLVVHVPASKLDAPVVDTVGAGDSFAGALGFFLMRTKNRSMIKAAVESACVVAATSVTRPDGAAGYPSRDDLIGRVAALE